jgi:hypothetical protein
MVHWFTVGAAAKLNRTLYDLGTSVYFHATFHELDRVAFLDLQGDFLSEVSKLSVGASNSIVYRDLDVSQLSGPLGYEARLLFDFSPEDETPASLLKSTLARDPEVIFSKETFGAYDVSHATMLQCASPCGEHGLRSPLVTEGSESVACTCLCDTGWETEMNQPFESFKYCTNQADGTGGYGGNQTSNITTDWRPPLPAYPPPPPKTYENESAKTKIPLFKWIIIGVSVIVLAVIVFVLCRTKCCGLCSLSCCAHSPGQYKYPRLPHRVEVHASQQPYYTFSPPDQHMYPTAQFFPAARVAPPQQVGTTSPLGNGFNPPES